MCIQDWQLGGLFRSTFRQFTSDLVTPTVVAANRNRVILNVAATGSVFSAAHTLQLSAGGVQVFQLDVTVHFIKMARDDFGDLPSLEWSLLGTGGARTYTIWESFLPAEYLDIPVEYFRHPYKPVS